METPDVVFCRKCGRSDSEVVFKRLEKRDKICQICFSEYQAFYYVSKGKGLRDPESERASDKRYYESHREQRKEYRKGNPIPNRVCARRSYLLKKAFIQDKKRGPCSDCGGVFPYFVMDFDHRDPFTKSGNISHLLSHSSFRLLAEEIEKCDLVCSNCHRKRTFAGKDNLYTGIKLRKRTIIDSMRSCPCEDCGLSFESFQMDFDHLGGKMMMISAMLNYSESTILAEIAKCEVVCSNCHRIRTHSRSQEAA